MIVLDTKIVREAPHGVAVVQAVLIIPHREEDHADELGANVFGDLLSVTPRQHRLVDFAQITEPILQLPQAEFTAQVDLVDDVVGETADLVVHPDDAVVPSCRATRCRVGCSQKHGDDLVTDRCQRRSHVISFRIEVLLDRNLSQLVTTRGGLSSHYLPDFKLRGYHCWP